MRSFSFSRYHIRKIGGDTIETARIVTGTFFLLIIVANFVATSFGYETFSKLSPAEKLTEIHDDPKRFKAGFWMILFEHVCLIGLAVSMFLAFERFSITLAVIWLAARSAEGLIQIIYKVQYRKLLGISHIYAYAEGSEQDTLMRRSLKILTIKNAIFCVAQILFSVGTFAYSLTFVLYDIFPLFLGWFGIAAAVIYGSGSIIKLVKDSQAVWNIGGLMILVYELVLGGWLVIDTIIS